MSNADMKLIPTLPEDLLSVRIDEAWFALHEAQWRRRTKMGDVLQITFIDTESGFSENASVNYAEIAPVGRAEAYQIYQGVGNREIPLNFQFAMQGGPPGGTVEEMCNNEVVLPARWLESLKYPVYKNGVSYSPPPVILKIGKLFRHRCILTDCQIQYKAPLDTKSLMPYAADVSATFVVVRNKISAVSTFWSR